MCVRHTVGLPATTSLLDHAHLGPIVGLCHLTLGCLGAMPHDDWNVVGCRSNTCSLICMVSELPIRPPPLPSGVPPLCVQLRAVRPREVAACGARRPSIGYCPARYQRVGPNVPTNSSGRHGPRPDGEAGDEASQFEFGMPATVPLGPGRIILRGVLRPSHAAFGRGHTQQTVLCLACICRCSQHNQA